MRIRSFLAIELPSALQDAIVRRTDDLRRQLPFPLVRWVSPENVHLTLKFLGEISPQEIEKLVGNLRSRIAEHQPFPLSLAEWGAFPSPKRPRVIWIGVQAPPALPILQSEVEAICARLGHPPEDRPFSPHLTIGRVNQHLNPDEWRRVRQAMDQFQVGEIGSISVEAIHLFRSDLRPDGAVYSILHTFPLGKQEV